MRYYNNPMPPRHHYFLDTLAIIILLAIGAGGAYLMSPTPNNNTTQQSGQSANSNSSNHSGNLTNQIKSKVSNKVNDVKDKVEHKPAQPVNRPGYTLAGFPKSIQGTWYSLDKFSNGEGKKLDKIIITPTKVYESGGDTITLHSRSKHSLPGKPNNATKDWCDAVMGNFKGMPLVNVRGWSQSAGDGVDYLALNTNGMNVLDVAGGAGVSTDANYFHTPAQAKQYANKTFHGEHRDNP